MNKILLSLRSILGSIRSPDRQLQGTWSLIARVIYIVLFLDILLGQISSIFSYFQVTNFMLSRASIDVLIGKTTENQFIVTGFFLDTYASEIEVGDKVLKIDDTVLQPGFSAEEVNLMLEGLPGDAVTVTVQKNDGNIQQYEVVRWKPLVDQLNKFYIQPVFFFWFLFGVFGLLMLSTTAVSFLIFRARTNDWFVILIAISILILPFSLNEVLNFFRTVGSPEIVEIPILQPISSLTHYGRAFGMFLGPPLLLLAIYLFPDGRFVPQKAVWMLLLFLFAHPYSAYGIGSYTSWIWIFLLICGFAFQIYRHKSTTNLVQQQQTKWAMIGFLGIISTLVVSELLPLFKDLGVIDGLGRSIWESIFFTLRDLIFFGFALFVSSILLAFSVYRYKLWDADFYINRAFIYGLVTGILAITWTLTVQVLQYFFLIFSDQQSPLLATILSSIQVAALFNPVRMRVEKWVNQRFYKDRINFVEAIVELQPEKWQFISTKDMIHLLVAKTAQLIKSTRCALYIYDKKGLRFISAFEMQKKETNQISVEPKNLELLKKGKVVKLPGDNIFELLVPLSVPRGNETDFIGLLALGPRKDGSGYSRDHLSDLADLGRSAGLSIHFLQLNENKKVLHSR